MRSQISFVFAALLAGSVAYAGAAGQPVAKGSTAVERGTLDMGGGANIRSKQGKPLTMAEAGYVFDQAAKLVSIERDSYYPISDDTKTKLMEVLKALLFDYPERIFDEIIANGDRSVFIDRTKGKIDQNRYQTIKSTYRKVIAASGKRLDESAFMLAAYSDADKTYILPEYEDLTDEPQQPAKYRKALNLFHEFWMRKTQDVEPVARLHNVLQFDSAVHRLLTSARTDEDVWRFHMTLQQMPEPFKAMASSARISDTSKRLTKRLMVQFETRLGRPVLASEMVLHPVQVKMMWYQKFDPSLVKEFNQLIPYLDARLEGTEIGFVWDEQVFWWAYRSDKQWASVPVTLENYSAWLTRVLELIGWDYGTQMSTDEAPIKAAQLREMFNLVCAGSASRLASSKVAGDFILHFDNTTQALWGIKCADPNDPARSWPRGGPIRFTGYSAKIGLTD
jgi:hypothetical protein